MCCLDWEQQSCLPPSGGKRRFGWVDLLIGLERLLMLHRSLHGLNLPERCTLHGSMFFLHVVIYSVFARKYRCPINHAARNKSLLRSYPVIHTFVARLFHDARSAHGVAPFNTNWSQGDRVIRASYSGRLHIDVVSPVAMTSNRTRLQLDVVVVGGCGVGRRIGGN